MIRRPPRSTQGVSSTASDVYKRQPLNVGLTMPRKQRCRSETRKIRTLQIEMRAYQIFLLLPSRRPMQPRPAANIVSAICLTEWLVSLLGTRFLPRSIPSPKKKLRHILCDLFIFYQNAQSDSLTAATQPLIFSIVCRHTSRAHVRHVLFADVCARDVVNYLCTTTCT